MKLSRIVDAFKRWKIRWVSSCKLCKHLVILILFDKKSIKVIKKILISNEYAHGLSILCIIYTFFLFFLSVH